MRQTTYDPETKIASIQPGTTWATAYGDLEPYHVTVAGGRTGTVGIGGFLLGGGNTFYAAREGFGCDNVVNFEIVLANGYVEIALITHSPT
jgi:FAD/FMN-containing dehydrogenase